MCQTSPWNSGSSVWIASACPLGQHHTSTWSLEIAQFRSLLGYLHLILALNFALICTCYLVLLLDWILAWILTCLDPRLVPCINLCIILTWNLTLALTWNLALCLTWILACMPNWIWNCILAEIITFSLSEFLHCLLHVFFLWYWQGSLFELLLWFLHGSRNQSK